MKTILATALIFIGLNSYGQVQTEQQNTPKKKIIQTKEVDEKGLVYGAEMETKKFKKPESIKVVSNESKGTIVTKNQ